MERDKHVSVMLPPASATAGKVLAAVSKSIQGLFEKHKPIKFMFGCPATVISCLCGNNHGFHSMGNLEGALRSLRRFPGEWAS